MAGLESATTINQLNPLNPSDTLDYVSTGDDHLRLLKSTIQNTFPRIAGATSASDADLTNVTYLADTGTTNALAVTFSPAWTSYVAGKGVLIKVLNTNTGAATLNVNSLGAQAIIGNDGQALIGGELIAGSMHHLIYSTAGFRLIGCSGYTRKNQVEILPYTGTTAYLVNRAAGGSLSLYNNGVTALTCNADGSVTVGTLNATTINGGVFPAGTTLPFYQGAAPTGWYQIGLGNDYLIRCVPNGWGGGSGGGTHNPILNNVVPAHTHSFTTGTESAYHTHDVPQTANYIGQVQAGTGTANVQTTMNRTSYNQNSFHTHSGSTDNGSSQTNWSPRYLNFIVCAKS